MHKKFDSSRLNLLLVSPFPLPDHGGISNWTRILCKGLTDRPDVDLSFIDTGLRYRSVTNMFLPLRLVGGSAQALRDSFRLYRRLRKGLPDVMHLCTSASIASFKDIVMLKMAKMFGVPSVIHYHFGRLPDIIRRNTPEWRLIRHAASLTDVVIPLDMPSETALKQAMPNLRIEKIRNMVEIDVINSILAKADNNKMATESYHITFVGHVIPTKGVRELTEACARLTNIPLLLEIIGPSNENFKMEIEQIASKRDGGRWLRLAGPLEHDEALRRMAMSDLFILPSYTEGMPNVVLEAMACGKTIIGTTVGAIPEMLEIGSGLECGVCIPPRDADMLAAAIVKCYEQPGLCKEYGLRARRAAVEKFSVPVVCSQLIDIWRSLKKKTTNLI